MTTTKRLTKKDQYLNGLVFDLDHFKTDLERMVQQKQFTTWWHGELITRTQVRQNIEEIRAELDRIETDSTYKPWIE